MTAARRLTQAAIALALASTLVLITQWAYPTGHLAIRLGRPQYSRFVGGTNIYVSIALHVQNVGVEPVNVDREHFLLIDDRGHVYPSDPSSEFLAFHPAAMTVLPLEGLNGTLVFRLPAGRTAARLVFVTATGEIVRLTLS
jgi:hypothetical protein